MSQKSKSISKKSSVKFNFCTKIRLFEECVKLQKLHFSHKIGGRPHKKRCDNSCCKIVCLHVKIGKRMSSLQRSVVLEISHRVPQKRGVELQMTENWHIRCNNSKRDALWETWKSLSYNWKWWLNKKSELYIQKSSKNTQNEKSENSKKILKTHRFLYFIPYAHRAFRK